MEGLILLLICAILVNSLTRLPYLRATRDYERQKKKLSLIHKRRF